jgi:putative ABC transport system permease protein
MLAGAAVLLQDIRYAIRMFSKSPGYVALAVLALGLGIGANATIFSCFNVYLLRPMPSVKEPDRLMVLTGERRGFDIGISYPDFVDWKQQSRAFEGMVAVQDVSPILTGRGDADRLLGDRVTEDFFQVYGVAPTLGRAFLPAEYATGAEPVLLLSNSCWERRFGGTPSILGQSLVLDEVSYRIVGVMPPKFRYSWDDFDFWAPLTPSVALSARGRRPLDAMARLKPGVSRAAAQADMDTIARRLEAEYPETNQDVRAGVQDVLQAIGRGPRESISILMWVVAFVLLIACSNVANLQLARATGRSGEIAIRVALGASRWRIVRQVLTESVMVALAGGISGLALALAGTKILLATLPASIQPINPDFLDPALFAYAAAIALTTGVVSGLAPAFQVSRVAVNDTLKEGGRSGSGGAKGKLRSTLVVVEVTLAVVLLLAAGLLIRSFSALQEASPGFRVGGLLTANVRLPDVKYPKPEMRAAFFRDLVERVSTLPGVQSAAVGTGLPLMGGSGNNFVVEGRPAPPAGQEFMARTRSVTPACLDTLGIPLRRGRGFSEQDSATALRVIVVNDRLVQQFFPDADPIGKRLKFGNAASNTPWMTIVGVVGNTRGGNATSPPQPEIYSPFPQSPGAGGWLAVRVRSGEATALAPALRAELRNLDRDLPLTQVRTMQALMENALTLPKLMMVLTTIFAGIALWMAAMGIYGVVSYSVAQRTRELGIRMALGANRANVIRIVLTQVIWMVLLGLAIGVPAAAATTRMLQVFLYGVGARDPLTFVAVPAALAAVALLASYIPALRATRVDPVVALRCE